MTTLDERARSAAREMNSAVAEADLLLFESGIPALRQKPAVTYERSRVYVFAGAFAAILLFIGLTLAPGRLTVPDDPEGQVASEQVTQTPDGSANDGTGDPATVSTAPGDVAPSTGVDLTPPAITVTKPANGEEFDVDDFGGAAVPLLEFSGTAEPGSAVVANQDTEQEASASVEPDGTWTIELVLQTGTNTVRFTAIDAAGNEQDATVTVTYTADTASTTSTPVPPVDAPRVGDVESGTPSTAADDAAPGVDFTAASASGEAVGNPAVDVFTGTAEPGSTVQLTSEYGRGAATADADGDWQAELTFLDAPVDEPFLVTVTAESGERLKLEFVVRAG